MDLNSNVFAALISCGGIFAIIGLFMLIFPPGKINLFYGYRTKRSRKGQANWDFAQRFSALQMIKAGIFLVLLSLFAVFIDWERFESLTQNLIITIPILSAAVFIFMSTERALKTKFKTD
ncbi:SdpI family protein [Flavimarina sp. Hel_I_48]|uniref:SdpI family protein n=1 Tax=Flavimarina sp. Hel_I_48 TaxID=1392488 RepID=UPI00055E4257|nr:SdpI family protein [Flavimarina sp. Hel_I_48]